MVTDVLIVGAGPTGLMLANQLGRRGIRVAIVDRHSGPAQQSRAMAVHARTLEIYAQLGIAGQAIELGRRGNGANMWSGGRLRARIPFEEMGKNMSPYPYVLMLGQDDNERIMGDHLQHWNIAVQWNAELVALEQKPEAVTATIKDLDGTTRTITAAYVVGCDGSHSAVREMNGIGFPGAPKDLVPSLAHDSGAGMAFKSCAWFSTYRIHHRCTERFRDRRCFLAGDAAHVHSPMGGQGMNTGLQDAYNLAWKLALVIAQRADPSLLDSYQAERMPVAHRLLETTDRAFKFVVNNTWLVGMLRTYVLPRVAALVMKSETVKTMAFPTLSQIGISYRESPLSRSLPGVGERAPRAGDRFPWLQIALEPNGPNEDLFEQLDDTRFNAIVIGQPAPSAESLGLGDLVRVHAIPTTGDNSTALTAKSIATPSYYLLRPDGHIGLAGTQLDVAEVKRWLADNHLHLENGTGHDVHLRAS